MSLRSPATFVAACGVALSVGLVSGCQDNPTPADASASAGVNQELADLVPGKIRKDGVLRVGIDPTYPPMEYLVRGEATGADLDIMRAIGSKLGLEVEFVEDAYALLVPGVAAGRFEAAISALTIDDTDLQNANMVSYFRAGTQLAVRPPAKKRFGPKNLCNRRITVLDGSVQYAGLVASSANCVENKKKPIRILTYQSQEPATEAVIDGKAYGTLADSPVIERAVAQSDAALVTNGKRFDVKPYGIAVSRDKKQRPLGKAIAGAIDAMIEDGSYRQILDEWQISDGAIKRAKVLTKSDIMTPEPTFSTSPSASPTPWASPTP